MPVFQLSKDIIFPNPLLAESDGLLAIGGDLSPLRLLTAYRAGIFPWYTEGEPILWWSPTPRLVLFPNEFHLPKRLGRTIKNTSFTLTTDQAFSAVINSCAKIREKAGEGTWITTEMINAYCKLHQMGFCHSVECWQDNTLVGGLYGIALDRVFFGESMFSIVTDASKVALATLVRIAETLPLQMIDCQMTTSHLQQFGCREISGVLFQDLLQQYIQTTKNRKKWRLE
jgi:leucyl/phenylalanyl-tRNA--protein transferase